MVVERLVKSGPSTRNWDKAWIAMIVLKLIAKCVVATFELNRFSGEPIRTEMPLWILSAVIFGFGW